MPSEEALSLPRARKRTLLVRKRFALLLLLLVAVGPYGGEVGAPKSVLTSLYNEIQVGLSMPDVSWGCLRAQNT
jgi:hypothetical protein